MTYQQKTTLVSIHTGWDDGVLEDVSIDSLYDIQGDLAIITAQRCQMDIMSVNCSLSLHNGRETLLDQATCFSAIVYVNNGRTLDEIVSMMKPEESIKRYWQIVSVYREHGGIQIQVYISKEEVRR